MINLQMNLYITHMNPRISAMNLVDLNHVLLKCMEILSIWHHFNVDNKSWICPIPFYNREIRDKNIILNAPINNWVEQDKANLRWIFDYAVHILDEHDNTKHSNNSYLDMFNILANKIYPHIQGIDSSKANIAPLLYKIK